MSNNISPNEVKYYRVVGKSPFNEIQGASAAALSHSTKKRLNETMNKNRRLLEDRLLNQHYDQQANAAGGEAEWVKEYSAVEAYGNATMPPGGANLGSYLLQGAGMQQVASAVAASPVLTALFASRRLVS